MHLCVRVRVLWAYLCKCEFMRVFMRVSVYDRVTEDMRACASFFVRVYACVFMCVRENVRVCIYVRVCEFLCAYLCVYDT